MNDLSFLQDLLVLFAAGIVAVVAFHRLNLPPVLGFLLTGVVCGPFGFKLVDDVHGVETLAEIGVVLLLFALGIEFSVEKFLRLRKFMLLAGGLQVALTVGTTCLLTMAAGLPWQTATFLGLTVSLSSTIVVIRVLEYRGDLDSAHGRAAVSILIFQDLLIAPMVLAVPYLSGTGASGASLAWTLFKSGLFVLGCAAAAKYLVPLVLNQVAETRRREAFILSIILICLGTAVGTAQVGLSMALGAFVAGLVISNSKYSHQALSEIVPFREVFNCLVFVSIGMMFDVATLVSHPLTVATALVAVLTVKAAIGAGVTFVSGHSLRVSVLTGVALAQIGEFSFVLAKVGHKAGLIDGTLNQVFLAVGLMSMVATPALTASGSRIADWLAARLPARWFSTRRSALDDAEMTSKRDHVVIVGYGLHGQNMAQVLDSVGVPFVVIEVDPVLVRKHRAQGLPIFYGDASMPEVLHHAAIDRARVIALTMSDARSTLRAAELARRLNPSLHVIARARHMDEVEPLIKVGSHEVVAEELAGSTEMFTRVLERYLVPRDVLETILDEARAHSDGKTLALLCKHRPGEGLHKTPANLALDAHRVDAASPLAGKTLAETRLRARTGVTVVAIQRGSGRLTVNPDSAERLMAGDTVILLGNSGQFRQAALLLGCGGQEKGNQPD